jgi:hypothetical protein
MFIVTGPHASAEECGKSALAIRYLNCPLILSPVSAMSYSRLTRKLRAVVWQARECPLTDEIHQLVDNASSDKHASILTFLLYFSQQSSDLIAHLIDNANTIYGKEKPANLNTDVEFLNRFCDGSEIKIPEKVDLAESRRKRREAKDEAARNVRSLANPGDRKFGYSEELEEVDKFHLAARHIELLGQVLRNFPGSLPGTEKLSILRSVYLLGLRRIQSMFHFFRTSVDVFEDSIGRVAMQARPETSADIKNVKGLVENLILMLNTFVVLGTLLAGC